MHLSITVIICAYSDERRGQLDAALQSVEAQTSQAEEVIIVIDHNPRLADEVARAFPWARITANSGKKGLSGARNTGLALAGGDVVAFLDDDASAEPDWIARMRKQYEDETVVGLGGSVVPVWEAGRPKWFPAEFDWVVGCSYLGLPEVVSPIRNPIGCNMSFRRRAYGQIGGFREGIGRTANDASGCEETEYFIRMRQAFPSQRILLEPGMKVHHHVPADRGRWSYFVKRCLAEGRSKTMVVDRVGADAGLSAERSYVLKVLPGGILRGLRETLLGRDVWGIARAGGIIAGLGCTAFGYFGARLMNARS